MNIWMIFAALVGGWMVQLWLAMRQSQTFLHAQKTLRPLGTVAVGKGGRRYRGGVAFVTLATDGQRVTGAMGLRGFTTFARPREIPALVGLRLNVVAGDRPVPGLKDNERAAAREAAGMLRAARGTTGTGATNADVPESPLRTGAASPA